MLKAGSDAEKDQELREFPALSLSRRVKAFGVRNL